MKQTCIGCDNLIYTPMDGFGGTHARCKAKTPPKKGKILNWCCTTLMPYESGYDRAKRAMEKQKTPKWCPGFAGDE